MPSASGRFPGPGEGRRRRLAARTGAPYLVPLLLVLAAGALAWTQRERILAFGRLVPGGEAQVREALANQQRAHLEDVYGFKAGGTLELAPVRFTEVSAAVEGGRADVVALLDAEGRAAWRDQAAQVAYIGREHFGMKPCSIASWCADGEQFRRLRGVLLALFRRHDALAGGEAGARRVLAWQIRADRDRAEVGEDFETAPPGGGRPVRERARFALRWDGSRWLPVP